MTPIKRYTHISIDYHLTSMGLFHLHRLTKIMTWINNPRMFYGIWSLIHALIRSGDYAPLPTSTTRFACDMGYRMAKKLTWLYKEIIFMNTDIKFLNTEWRTPYPITNFEDCFGLHASIIFLDSNMCGFLIICTLANSQTLVAKWQI